MNDTSWIPAPDLVVTDPAAVDILWHPNKRIHLKPFLGRSADLAEASRELGVKKTAMSYWINRLAEVGLIRAERIEKRSRHQATFYRCVADRLRVGLDAAPLESYEGVFDDFSRRWNGLARAAMARSLARQAPDLELCFAAHGAAGPFTTILPRDGHVPVDDFIFYWARLWLTEDEKRSLNTELNALYDKYGALSDKVNKKVPALLHLIEVREDT
jgi:DNA-binding transcriptional ArsR family regulator